MAARIAVILAAAALLFGDGIVRAQNWELIVPSPMAVGCSEPDVLGDSVCIAVEAGEDGPRVWMFGERDVLWDTVAVSVDDGEVFVALDGDREWIGVEGRRLIDALRGGSRAFVTTDVDEVFVDLSGVGVIDDVIGR